MTNNRYWVSWWTGNYADEGCTLPPFQSWITGQRDGQKADSERDEVSMCAVLDAPSEDVIWEGVAHYFPDYQERFCEQHAADFKPAFTGFEGRTDLGGYMEKRNALNHYKLRIEELEAENSRLKAQLVVVQTGTPTTKYSIGSQIVHNMCTVCGAINEKSSSRKNSPLDCSILKASITPEQWADALLDARQQIGKRYDATLGEFKAANCSNCGGSLAQDTSDPCICESTKKLCELTQMPTLSDWSITKFYSYAMPSAEDVRLMGVVTGHPLMKDNHTVTTSIIKSFNWDERTATTYNTTYKLEKIDSDFLSFISHSTSQEEAVAKLLKWNES